MKLTPSECATVLAALRLFQEQSKRLPESLSSHFSEVRPLSDVEIDGLCERFNFTAMFENHYECPNDGTCWVDVWSCACNDRCPTCNAEIEPFESEQI
jgi:hypothetical protein